MDKYLIYALHIVVIALPLSLFEIIIEKDHGWGSGWDKNKWYAKPFMPTSTLVARIVKMVNVQHPLTYHVLVFVCIIPVFLIFEYIQLVHNGLLLLSAYLAILILEDFLWFVFNWNFDSLSQLLKGPHGSIWWQKSWIKISTTHYLPTAYFVTLTISLALLFLA
ncbi:MAG: hypothetical protein Q7S28_02740 [bacterium]|nr:hypothetical protein [bacterium]